MCVDVVSVENMLRRLKRLSRFILRLALVSVALSVVVFLVSTPSQLLPREDGDTHIIIIIDLIHYVWEFPNE